MATKKKRKYQGWITRTLEDGTRQVRLLNGKWITPKELLLLVLDNLKAEPRVYRQSTFCSTGKEYGQTDCKTVACIGGWAWMIVTGRPRVSIYRGQSGATWVGNFLTGRPGWLWLFGANFEIFGGKNNFMDQIHNARTLLQRVHVAARAIKYFIKTEKLK